MEQQSYLSELEFNPVLAGAGKRFLNYLIDFIFYYALLFFSGVLLASAGAGGYVTSQDNIGELYLFVFVIFIAYYFICETVFKGRTIGKFITGTKAVNEDGTEITAKTALLRTLCRIVPFEPFSALGGHPWHDKWTKTYVIDIKKTTFSEAVLQ